MEAREVKQEPSEEEEEYPCDEERDPLDIGPESGADMERLSGEMYTGNGFCPSVKEDECLEEIEIKEEVVDLEETENSKEAEKIEVATRRTGKRSSSTPFHEVTPKTKKLKPHTQEMPQVTPEEDTTACASNSAAAPSSHATASTSSHTSTPCHSPSPPVHDTWLCPDDGKDHDESGSELEFLGRGWPESESGMDLFDSESESDMEPSSSDSESDTEPSSSDDEEELLHWDRRNGQDEGKFDASPLLDWSRSNGADFVPELHDFSSEKSGSTGDWPCTDDSRESDFFTTFLDNEVLSFIANNTNKFYHYESQRKNVTSSKFLQWVDTTPRELTVFIALLLLMTLCKKYVLAYYWRNDPLIPTPIFGKYMTRNRFFSLLTFLQFADIDTHDGDDKGWKVRDMFSMFLSRFRKYFYPFQKVVIDESMVLFRGYSVFKQYVSSKVHHRGVKLFVLCDCYSGVVTNMLLYAGQDNDIPQAGGRDPLGLPGAVVRQVMEPYLGKGHILYTHSRYTSPALCQFLHDNKTGSCGTVKSTTEGMPEFLGYRIHLANPRYDDGDSTDEEHRRRKQQRRQKQLYVQREKSGKLLAVKWNDGHPVHLLSTIHKGEIADTGRVHQHTNKPIKKPDVVTDYMKTMCFADKSYCQLSSVDCLNKSVKWHHQFFFHLIDIAMLNAYNIWVLKKEMPAAKKPKLREFISTVCFQLLEEFGEPTGSKKEASMPERISGCTSRHYIVRTEMANGRRRRVNCHVCLYTTQRPKKKSRINVMCNECKVGLCIGECFRIYHTYEHF